MPTNDERRDVAARLRNYENLRESFRESPICAFLDALGVEYLDWKGVCNRLAELIEPEPERTCTVRQAYFDSDDELYELMDCISSSPEDTVACICDSCGIDWRYDRCIRPNYCPNCGSKVIANEMRKNG